MCGFRNMPADRQANRQTYRHADNNTLYPYWDEVNILSFIRGPSTANFDGRQSSVNVGPCDSAFADQRGGQQTCSGQMDGQMDVSWPLDSRKSRMGLVTISTDVQRSHFAHR